VLQSLSSVPGQSAGRLPISYAQIESAFRTVKYGPTWPGVFDDIAEARDWFAEYVRVYNGQHHHSSLAGFTPGEVYDGSWIDTSLDA
jgi:putative transposase